MKRPVLLGVCASLLLAGCRPQGPATGPTAFLEGDVRPVPRGEPAAAAETRDRLRRKGTIDGRDWSVTLDCTECPLRDVLEWLGEWARGEPQRVNLLVDEPAIAREGIDLGVPVTLRLKAISMAEALKAACGDRLGYAVLDDGDVLVSIPRRLADLRGGHIVRPFHVRPTPAAVSAWKKLTTRGLVGGEDWSISLSLTTTALGPILDFVAEAARAEPREITLLVDRSGIAAAGIDLDDPLNLNVRNVSIARCLDLVLPQGLGYAILDDGTVLVSARGRLASMGFSGGPVVRERTEEALRTLDRITSPAEGERLDLDVDGARLDGVLQAVIDFARGLPAPVAIALDHWSIDQARVALHRPVTVHLAGLSVARALDLLLPAQLAVVVLKDGTVSVTSREGLDRDLPAAVLAAREKLWSSRSPDGRNWTVNLQMSETSLGNALGFLREAAADRLELVIDREAIGGANLDDRVTIEARDVSVGQALAMLLGDRLGAAIRRDGAVIVSTAERIRQLTAEGQAFSAARPPPPVP